MFLQRTTIFLCFFIGYIFLSQLWSDSAKRIGENKKQIFEISNDIKKQQEIIKKYNHGFENKRDSDLSGRIHPVYLSNFIDHISILAKQNSVDILSIHPEQKKENQEKDRGFYVQSFQINVTVPYEHLLQFMQRISTMQDFAIVDDFKITLSSASLLNMTMVVSVYGQADGL
jgi:hypothetical protein